MAFIRNTDKLVEGVVNKFFSEQRAQDALASTVSGLESADSALDLRLDVIEGSGAGSIAKAQADAQAYADQKVAALVNSAPEVLDTLKELADALGGDASFATTVASQIGAVDDKVDQEILDRQSGDSALDLRLDALELDPVTKTYVDSAVSALDGRIDSLEADPVSKTYVDSADSALSGRLDIIEGSGEGSVEKAEQDAKDYADGLNSAMDARVDALEADPVTKTYVDGEISDLQGQITQEISDRQSADNALDGRLDLLEADPVTKTYVDALDTDDIDEGSRLYFTTSRAREAAVVNSSAGNETDQAMSVSAAKGYFEPLIGGAEEEAQKFVGNVEVFSSNGAIDSDNVMCLVDLTGGSITLTLPNVSGMTVGRKYIIKEQKGLASQSVFITVQRQGSSEKIDGENSYQIKVPYESISLMWDGSNWLVF